jgi:intein/homing endonuclease
MRAKISEIFDSIQGEGVYQGVRQIFVRFAGCIQRCNFCICDNTKIILSNGTERTIEKLKKCDELLAFDEVKEIIGNTTVDRILQGETEEVYELTLEEDNKLRITGEHLIFTRRGWVKIKNVQVSDEVLTIER